MKWIRLSVAVAVVIATISHARAWGPEGHDIVGRIAELHLTTNAAQAVSELLGNERHMSDDAVSNWADNVRKARTESAPWHYVDIPFAADKYDPERDCENHKGCVVEAIANFQHVLADRQTNTLARTEALKFLVHFVGDIHQPLHCGERNGDQGGNKCYVGWPGAAKSMRLHIVWDINLPQKNLREARLGPVAYADRLNDRITAPMQSTWNKGTSADWAWESHQLAVTKVYADIPADGSPAPLSDEYVKASQALVDEQLMKAGIRLAGLLNEALK